MFAIGRAQELMLILEEEWSRDERLKDIPIFYFGDMARKCLVAYDTYLSLMNEEIRKRHLEEGRSPFKFNFIRHVTKTSDPIFHNRPAGAPCVAIASPGMLQSGISLELFERYMVVVLGIICDVLCVLLTFYLQMVRPRKERRCFSRLCLPEYNCS
jgi:cleavage and polyadenylation specificity factor subunit 3